MTRDEILAMKPGRELDRLIHQNVLGKRCRFIPMPDRELQLADHVFTSDRQWLIDDWLDEETNRELEHYSETWEGAGLIVEAMRPKGWYVTMNGPDGYDGRWFARFRSRTFVENATADTAPHAVALAALLAVGGGDAR